MQKQVELLDKLKEWNEPVIVLDAQEILLNPEAVLSELCKQLGIAWDPSVLHWSKGPRSEDGCWAKYWYHSVHNSTGFAPFEERDVQLPEYLKPLLDECLPYYRTLAKLAIKAPRS
jgi:hypothetical protein